MSIHTNQVAIPDYFGRSVHRFFGEEGDAWFAQLDVLLLKCIHKWHLGDCQIAENLSVNLICYAVSPEYGPVVLKIGFPHPEFYSELTALKLYKGRNVCALYDADLELGAMLISRVLPGYNLKTVDDEKAQLDIALDVIANLPMPAEPHSAIPAFSDWIERAFARARREKKVEPDFLFYLDQVEKFFDEVTVQEPAHMLLHGDLHHENMLYREDGEWVVIDPKGVTGIRSLETGRYILNAIWFTQDAQKPRVLEALVHAFAEAFQRPRRTIAICAMVDCVLSRTWTFEEHLTPEAFAREHADALRMFPMYLDCVKRMSRSIYFKA